MTVVFTARRIAELLADPQNGPLLPTAEQGAVIEYPLAGSALVVAGAGSGKTETMANRVVWLIANGFVQPEQVLGLTFTRKAAGELRERVMGRLEAFRARMIDAAEQGRLGPEERRQAAMLVERLADGVLVPEIDTYNAFAAGVLDEFGIEAGLAPSATIIDESTAWRIAREVIVGSSDPALLETGLRIPELVKQTIALDHAVAENLTTFDRVERIVADFERVLNLPYDEKDRVGGPSGKNYAAVRDAVANLGDTPLVARLAHEFSLEKRRRGLLEFSDQLALATHTLEHSPSAIRVLRSRYQAVLLDEVQDTSVVQTRLLATLFSGLPVMAVGDPHQSIYGWRGASAEGLSSFHIDFAHKSAHDRSARTATLSLSTSWRNPVSVLDAANVLSAPLAEASPIDVPRLVPRPEAMPGQVDWLFPETIHEERAQLAEWMAEARRSYRSIRGVSPSAAVIFRTRRHMASFSASLREAGVPNQIIGVGGLLSTPEVTDLVSTLRCLWYADASGDLIRLLTGPRFRIGVADIAGLSRAARWFAHRDVSQGRLAEDDELPDQVLPDPDRHFTLVDALDELARTRDSAHPAFAQISDTGFARMHEAGRMLSALRQGVDDVTSLMSAVVRALRLDIELEAHERRGHDGGAGALANIDAFIELAEGHLAVDSRGTLASLLEWVERAVESDEAAEHVPPPAPGTVQLITVHGAKGLEWDIVAVPRLVESEFPAGSREGVGWLRAGRLPDELRGDAAARPVLDWRTASHQKELKQSIENYKSELKDRHAHEERRLAYVAVTRSADRLLLSGSFWGGQAKSRMPSQFLLELQQAGVIRGLPTHSQHDSDPSKSSEFTLQWPLDPLGARAESVSKAAEAVKRKLERSRPGDSEGLEETVRLLLAERDESRREHRDLAQLPDRLIASAFHEVVEDAARSERNRLRPIPRRPYRRTRVGNLFHEWVERRTTTPKGTAIPLFGREIWSEIPDSDNAAEDSDTSAGELAQLIENFEQSRWADRQPVAVELEITLPFAGRSMVCKLDAVYQEGEGSDARFEIVDWKTGSAPRDESERASRFLQLDLYRHAYAEWAGIDVERIDVTLFYVAERAELTGERRRSIQQLEQLWIDAMSRQNHDGRPGVS